MFVVLVSLVICFVGLCSGQSNCSTNGYNTITACYSTYVQFFNLTFVNGSAPSYITYATVLNEYLAKGGVPDYTKICQAQNTLIKCISAYDPICVNTQGFQQALGVSDMDANGYLTNLGIIKWDCNAGFNDMVNNWNCLQNLWDNHFDDIGTCDLILPPTLNMTGFNCLKGVSFIQCYTKAYGKYCGNTGAYIGCEFALNALNEIVPVCSSQFPPCSK